MPMTPYLRKKLGDHALAQTTYTKPTAVFAALFLSDPGEAMSQAGEVTGTGYARIDITAKMGAFSALTGIAVSTAEINYGSPGSDWGTVAYIGIMDAASGGNMLYKEQLPSPRSATSGSRSVKFGVGQVSIQHV